MISRRALLMYIVPYKQVDSINKNSTIIRNYETTNFKLQYGVKYDEDSVTTSEIVNWYDPISKEEMNKTKNTVYIIDEEFS